MDAIRQLIKLLVDVLDAQTVRVELGHALRLLFVACRGDVAVAVLQQLLLLHRSYSSFASSAARSSACLASASADLASISRYLRRSESVPCSWMRSAAAVSFAST